MAKTTITKILLRRGSEYDRKLTVMDDGEPGWTTDTCRLFVGDGRKEGGFPVVNIRTPTNTPAHKFNNDLIYEPLADITGGSQPPTQEVLAIHHPGLSGSITREWMDDRYVMKEPCDTNSLKYPADPIICAPNSGLLPTQDIKAHVNIHGDLDVQGHTSLFGGLAVSGIADFCEATILTDDIHVCAGGDLTIKGSTNNFNITDTQDVNITTTGSLNYVGDGDVNIAGTGDVHVAGMQNIGLSASERVITDGKAITLPIGPSSDRPLPAGTGDMRFNTTLKKFEGYDGIAWGSVGGDTKFYYIDSQDVIETSTTQGSRKLKLSTEMTAIAVPVSDQTSGAPVWVVPLVHNLNSVYPVITVYDDYRRVIIPDEVYLVDQNQLLVNLTSFLDDQAGWLLNDTGPGHVVASTGFVPPLHHTTTGTIQTTAPDVNKKWVITIQG